MIFVGVLSTLALTVLVLAAARRIARPVVAIAGIADRVAPVISPPWPRSKPGTRSAAWPWPSTP
jgi:hypothetical protein